MALNKTQILNAINTLLASGSDITAVEHRQTMYDIVDKVYDETIDGVSLQGNILVFTRNGGAGVDINVDISTATIIGTALQPGDNVSALTNDANYIATGDTQVDALGGLYEEPVDGQKKIFFMAYSGTITDTVTESVSGTCTATFSINGTPLGGTANSVSSTEETQVHASANTFVKGDSVEITISGNATCVDMTFAINFNRVL